METYLMVLIAIVATGGVILLFTSVGVLAYALWQRWFVEPSRQESQPPVAPAASGEAAQQ